MSDRKRILYLCTGNSCRSQMAEAWTRAIHGDRYEVFSAGVEPKTVDPRAARVMEEAGVPLTGHRSKSIDELPQVDFHFVITLCSHAQETCPYFPASTQRLHVPFDDPPRLAQDAASEEEALQPYRRVREEIRKFVEELNL
ncbi:arsenate reductase [Desulfacinum hydrothermale DSM 13146]|uniref:Arsenate reductase n=1 Tax=Desulfacinum hydrothermale DSM 13146 TaxID=1121390 RepID=A0A1W1XJE0_9BACT|nr:arsenate reductase ArsC [Desulfacinum hydrothermale]SMC24106.1 arsenate reductase [Desulfacinum hydrothermale DSM 13146]